MARLTAGLRARALIRLVESRGGFGAVLHRGDETAGDLMVRINAPLSADAGAPPVEILAPASTPDGAAAWMRLGRPGFADSAAADAAIARALTRDPDVWVLELEPAGPGWRPPDPILEAPDPAHPSHAAAEALFRKGHA